MLDSSLQILFLLDTSASMFGMSIEALKEGYGLISRTLGDLMLSNGWQLSVIAFDSQPRALIDPVEMNSPTGATTPPPLPPLDVGGVSNLGRACALIHQWAGSLPDGQPVWVFLLTDGLFTDEWQVALQHGSPARLTWFGVSCGTQADLRSLQPYLDQALDLTDHDVVTLATILQPYLRPILGTVS